MCAKHFGSLWHIKTKSFYNERGEVSKMERTHNIQPVTFWFGWSSLFTSALVNYLFAIRKTADRGGGTKSIRLFAIHTGPYHIGRDDWRVSGIGGRTRAGGAAVDTSFRGQRIAGGIHADGGKISKQRSRTRLIAKNHRWLLARFLLSDKMWRQKILQLQEMK